MTPSDEIERLVRLAGPRAAASDDRRSRVLARARGEWEALHARRARRRRTGIALLALAAAVVLAIQLWPASPGAPRVPASIADVATLTRANGAVSLMTGDDAIDLMQGARVPAGGRVRTGSGTVAGLTLEHGVSVRLDRDTLVRLQAADVVDIERGAVYIDTGGSRPGPPAMRVITPMGTLRDLGTQFEVRLSADRVRLRVREGVVVFERGRLSVQAGGGTELVAPSGGEPSIRPFAAFGPEWAWIGQAATAFNLSESSLREFLDWIERETGYKTAFGTADIGESASAVKLQGSIAGMSPEEALDVVLPAVGLEHRIENGTLVLERSGGAR